MFYFSCLTWLLAFTSSIADENSDSCSLLQTVSSLWPFKKQQKTTEAPIDASGYAVIPGMADLNPQFLLVTSTELGKIVYTKLKNSRSTQGRTFALVSSGLKSPVGVAFDKIRGYLYVADQAVPAIYRYEVYVDNRGEEPLLKTSGLRMTMMHGYPVQWLTLDRDGNLLYTAPDTNNIMRINAGVLQKIAEGEIKQQSLIIYNEKKLEAEAQEAAATPPPSRPTDAPPPSPYILELYEAKINPLVSTPAGIFADGGDLYWTNLANGTHAGAIVKGETHPTLVNNPNGSDYFYAETVTKKVSHAFNMAKVSSVVFFSHNGTQPGSGLVSALMTNTGDILDVVRSLRKPRGLAWDGDQTIYVADEQRGEVWSFPSGRFMADPPMQRAVKIQGAHGLTILNEHDPWYQNAIINYVQTGSSLDSLAHRAGRHSFIVVWIAFASVLAMLSRDQR